MMGVRNAEAGILRKKKSEQAVEEKGRLWSEAHAYAVWNPWNDLSEYSSLKNLKYRRDI